MTGPAWPPGLATRVGWIRHYRPKLRTSKRTREPAEVSCFYDALRDPIARAVLSAVHDACEQHWHVTDGVRHFDWRSAVPESRVKLFGFWRAPDGTTHAAALHTQRADFPTRQRLRPMCGWPNQHVPRTRALGDCPTIAEWAHGAGRGYPGSLTCERCITQVDHCINPPRRWRRPGGINAMPLLATVLAALLALTPGAP